MGISLNEFRTLASGNYNLGSIILDSTSNDGSHLAKVNNHKYKFWDNSVKVNATQNSQVRAAFYDAIKQTVQGAYGFDNAAAKDLLSQLNGELLGENKTHNLTRMDVHATLKKVDELLYRDVQPVGGNDQAVGGNDRLCEISNMKQFASEAGLSVAAVKRIVTNERDAFRFLVYSQIKSDDDKVAEKVRQLQLAAVRQLAGLNRISAADFGTDNQNAKVAFDLLKGGFPEELTKANGEVAFALCKCLGDLSDAKTEVVATDGALKGLKFLWQKDKTLAIEFNGKRESFPSLAESYVQRIEKAVTKAFVQEDTQPEGLKDLFEKLKTRVNGNPTSTAQLQHIRAVATIILVKKWGVTAEQCERLPKECLKEFAAAALNGEQKENAQIDGKNFSEHLTPRGVDPASVQELKALANANKADGKVKMTPPSNQAENDAQDVREANELLAKIASSSQMDGTDGFKATLQKLYPDVLKLIDKCQSKPLYEKLSPLSRQILDKFIDRLVAKVKAKYVISGNVCKELAKASEIIEDSVRKSDFKGQFCEVSKPLAEELTNNLENCLGTNGTAVKANLQAYRLNTPVPNNGFDIHLLFLNLKGNRDEVYWENFIAGDAGASFATDLQEQLKAKLDDSVDQICQKIDAEFGALCPLNTPNVGEMEENVHDKINSLKGVDHFKWLSSPVGMDEIKGKDFENYIEGYDVGKDSKFDGKKDSKLWHSYCARILLRPEYFYPQDLPDGLDSDFEKSFFDESLRSYEFYSKKPYVNGDVFDLLAATITSPTKLRECFPQGKKPSVEGAFNIVQKLLESFRSVAQDCYTNSDDDNVNDWFRDAVEGLANILSQQPTNLDADVLKSYLTEERTGIPGGRCLEFESLLKKLPGHTVAGVLKGICTFLLGNGLYNRTKENPQSVSKFLMPVFRDIKAWRDALPTDVTKLKTPSGYSLGALLSPPKETVGESSETRFGKLDPERIEKLDPLWKGKSEVGEREFVRKTFKNYLEKLKDRPCLRAKVMAALTSGATSEQLTGKYQSVNWEFLGALMQGCGPIMQKYLQRFEVPEDAPNEMRAAFDNVKSNLPKLPLDLVEAQLRHIVNSSGGRINSIDFGGFLGAATVGVAAKCKVHTKDNPDGFDCVIKFVRPEARNIMAEERELFGEVISGFSEGEKQNFTRRCDEIEKELDLTDEFDGLVQGDVYNGKSSDVSSVDPLPFVVPDSSCVIMKLAPGTTVDSSMRKAHSSADAFESVNRNINRVMGEGGSPKLDKEDVERWMESMVTMLETRKQLARTRELLESTAKVWFKEALKGDGFYHGDLHAGNIMSDANIATLIDFGNVGKLNEAERKLIADIFSGVWTGGQTGVDKFLASLNALDPRNELGLMNVKDETKKQLLNIFSSGKTTEDVFGRLKRALDLLSRAGHAVPPVLSRFLQAQDCLANAIRDVNVAIRRIDESVQSANQDGRWFLDKWPVPASDQKANLQKMMNRANELNEKVKGESDDFVNQVKKIGELAKGVVPVKQVSYADVIAGLMKDKAFAA